MWEKSWGKELAFLICLLSVKNSSPTAESLWVWPCLAKSQEEQHFRV